MCCALLSCRAQPADQATPAATPARSSPTALSEEARLMSAERRRDSAAIQPEALSSRDAGVRRTAARALARIADERSAELLELALADEDPEVMTWGAYGLGYACRGRELKVVPALVARAAGLPPATTPADPPLTSPFEAISDALGRCASREAESTLRAWLLGPRAVAESAALALGRLGERNGKLEDATLVALLDAADRVADPVQNALYPCSRLSPLNASTAARALGLARAVLTSRGPASEFAVRALGRAGDAGSAELGKRLADSSLPPALRAQAVRELTQLGSAGQHALWAAFDTVMPQTPSDTELSAESYGPLSALLAALAPPISGSDSKLRALATLPLDGRGSAALNRRKVHVRCAAAALLAGSNYRDVQLSACDPAPQSSTRDLAVLTAVGREKLVGRRKTAYLVSARSPDAMLREAAISALAEHPELDEAYQLLGDALAGPTAGVVASAAHVLSSYPERAERSASSRAAALAAPSPDPGVVKALSEAYSAAGRRNDIEVQSLLLDAQGALQILSAKESIASACKSDNPTLREHAEKALHLLGEQTRHCGDMPPGDDHDAGASTLGKTVLTLETEAGTLTLTLDPRFAPSAVARLVRLAKTGFYDGIAVHRVVPGFVAQFGDPAGDGYGGDGTPPLRCETSPVPFSAGDVGIALAGRDTGSSQLFVTLGRYPYLDGQYAWVGRAGPGWDRVAAGDRILRVHVGSVP